MRGVVGFAVIIISVLFAYMRYITLFKRARINEFFCMLSSRIVSNNTHEMLPFSAVFADTYRSFFDENPTVENSEEAFEYISRTLTDAINYDKIFDALLQLTKASENELVECEKELMALSEDGYAKACDVLKKYGKPSFLLYPAAAFTVLLVLI